jgi:hypothetical protein
MSKKVKKESFKIISVILISLLLIPTVLSFIEISSTPKNIDKKFKKFEQS